MGGLKGHVTCAVALTVSAGCFVSCSQVVRANKLQHKQAQYFSRTFSAGKVPSFQGCVIPVIIGIWKGHMRSPSSLKNVMSVVTDPSIIMSVVTDPSIIMSVVTDPNIIMSVYIQYNFIVSAQRNLL